MSKSEVLKFTQLILDKTKKIQKNIDHKRFNTFGYFSLNFLIFRKGKLKQEILCEGMIKLNINGA